MTTNADLFRKASYGHSCETRLRFQDMFVPALVKLMYSTCRGSKIMFCCVLFMKQTSWVLQFHVFVFVAAIFQLQHFVPSETAWDGHMVDFMAIWGRSEVVNVEKCECEVAWHLGILNDLWKYPQTRKLNDRQIQFIDPRCFSESGPAAKG